MPHAAPYAIFESQVMLVSTLDGGIGQFGTQRLPNDRGVSAWRTGEQLALPTVT